MNKKNKIKNWWGWLDVIQTKQLHWGRGFQGLVHLWTPLARVCSKGLFILFLYFYYRSFFLDLETNFLILGFWDLYYYFVKKFTTKLIYKMFKLLYNFAVCYFSAGKNIIFIYCTWVFFGYAWCTFTKINMYTW